MSELYGKMFDSNVRVEIAWPFPMTPPTDELVELLAELTEPGAKTHPSMAAVLSKFDDWARGQMDGSIHDQREVVEEVAGAMFRSGDFGWIAMVATPVMKPYADGEGASFSWGYYHTETIYAPTGDDLLKLAVEWAEAAYEADMAKAAA